MKVSDLMLDIATGDASVHDAYIQEAVGKVNVSNAIFKAAHQMTELDSSEMRYVQEAAENAGLPTDRKGLVKLVMESVNQQLAGVYDVATTTSKKITEALNKDFLLTKTIGKKLEVPLQGTICEYSTNLSTAIGNYFGGKKIDVGGKRFIKGDKAMEIAKNYTKGMSNLLSAFGLKLDKSRIPVNIIGESFVPCATPKSLNDVSSNLSDAIRLFDTPDIVQESDFTDVVAYSDLVKVPAAIHGILSISENAAGGGTLKPTGLGSYIVFWDVFVVLLVEELPTFHKSFKLPLNQLCKYVELFVPLINLPGFVIDEL